jgi:hypothetical protein
VTTREHRRRALDAILQGVDGGTLTAPEAIEQLLWRRFSCGTTAGCRRRCDPAACPPSSSSATSTSRFQPSLRREQIESLRALGFVERRENVIFLGPRGAGNTHLAISLAIAAAQSGGRASVRRALPSSTCQIVTRNCQILGRR